MKNTSFHATEGLQKLQKEVLGRTDLKKKVLQKKALESFLNNDKYVFNKSLLDRYPFINNGYLKREVLERILIDDSQDETIKSIVLSCGDKKVNRSIVLFQSIFDYCCKVLADEGFTQDEIREWEAIVFESED